MHGLSKHHHGFTLLEVLIAVAIFGIMAALAYGGLNSVINTKVELEQSQARLAEVQKAVFRIQGDIEGLQLRPVRDSLGQSLPALIYRADFSNTPQLELTRGGLRNPMEVKRAALERVRYRLESEKGNKTYRLQRQRWVVLDRSHDEEGLRSQTLLTRIKDLKWRFLDSQDVWQATWPPENQAALAATGAESVLPPPKTVELTLNLPDYGELLFLFRPVLPPAVQALTNAAGGAGGAGGQGGQGGQGAGGTGGNGTTTPVQN